VSKRAAAVILGLACVAFGAAYVQAAGMLAKEPLWAYGFLTPPARGDVWGRQGPPLGRTLRPDEDTEQQTRPRHVDGSSAAFSLLDIRDGQNVIDWFPGDHPPMPDVVKHGPARMGKLMRGCGSCHLPNGKGRPENAQPAALPVKYFIRQLQDFRYGFRRSADWRKPNTYTMMKLAMAMTDEEMRQAAEYFAAIKWNTPWVRVVETNLVPKTRIAGNLFVSVAKEWTEPIAGRIIEVPADNEQAELHRNPRSGFVAYVPVGSIAKGEDLVTTGGAKVVANEIVRKTMACGSCHGPDLMGIDDVPPIAGRSPSYMARQLYDFQAGSRNGAQAQLMKPVVANLTEDDIVAITAYVASRVPRDVRQPTTPRPAIRLPVTNTATR
jgi:cytochrome c553